MYKLSCTIAFFSLVEGVKTRKVLKVTGVFANATNYELATLEFEGVDILQAYKENSGFCPLISDVLDRGIKKYISRFDLTPRSHRSSRSASMGMTEQEQDYRAASGWPNF